MQIGDFILVQDSITQDILMSGMISKITENPIGFSIDGITFINPNSPRLVINKVCFSIKDNICYNYKITSDKYKIFKHNNIDNTFEYDFFMWNEIEPEVKEICELLNEIDSIETYSSCSGHGIIPPWVDFHIKDWNKFNDFLEFLKSNNLTSKTFKHKENKNNYRFIIGVEGRNTCHLESLSINDCFISLCKIIKKFIYFNNYIKT